MMILLGLEAEVERVWDGAILVVMFVFDYMPNVTCGL